jgi:hypothetical protein
MRNLTGTCCPVRVGQDSVVPNLLHPHFGSSRMSTGKFVFHRPRLIPRT